MERDETGLQGFKALFADFIAWEDYGVIDIVFGAVVANCSNGDPVFLLHYCSSLIWEDGTTFGVVPTPQRLSAFRLDPQNPYLRVYPERERERTAKIPSD